MLVTSLYAGLLALLLLYLSARCSARRIKARVPLGDGGDEGMIRATRAQGNFVEYVPLALLILALAEAGTAPAWLLHALGATLLAARLGHAWALQVTSGPHPGRMLGTLGTWVVLAVGGLVVIGQSLAALVA